MIRFSSRAEKISWISIFSLMLVIIIGLSVGLAVVSSKDEEDWDVVTKDYAYKTIYVTDADYPLAAKAYIKIKNLSSEYQNYTFDIKLYNKNRYIELSKEISFEGDIVKDLIDIRWWNYG